MIVAGKPVLHIFCVGILTGPGFDAGGGFKLVEVLTGIILMGGGVASL